MQGVKAISRGRISMVLIGISIGLLILYWTFTEPQGEVDTSSKLIYPVPLLETSNAYLWLMLASLFFPLILSFDQKVHFIGNWRPLLFTVLAVGLPYVIWDEYFTKWQIWDFNVNYLTGLYLGRLPIEEIGFFVVVPYACLFIFECVRGYQLERYIGALALVVVMLIFLVALCSGILYYDRYYTFASTLVFTSWVIVYLTFVKWRLLTQVVTAVFLTYIPFIIVNGALTGAFTNAPIVMYNNMENMDIRIGSIPLEDIFYQTGMMASLLMVYLLAPYFLKRLLSIIE